MSLADLENIFKKFSDFLDYIFLEISAKPRQPQNLDVSSVGSDSVTLSWRMPDDRESAYVTRFRIEKREVTSSRWDFVASVESGETSYTVRCACDVIKSDVTACIL